MSEKKEPVNIFKFYFLKTTLNFSLQKNQRISKNQKEKLVEYMSTHLEFARGQFGTTNANVKSQGDWLALTTKLNSLGGSNKTTDQWKKVCKLFINTFSYQNTFSKCCIFFHATWRIPFLHIPIVCFSSQCMLIFTCRNKIKAVRTI